LSSSEYSRIRELFQAATRLSSEEWDSFLDSECAGAPKIRRQVEELLEHHRSETVLEIPAGATTVPDLGAPAIRFAEEVGEAEAEISRMNARQRRVMIALAASSAVMLGIGLALFFGVRSSMRASLEVGLNALASRTAADATSCLSPGDRQDLAELVSDEVWAKRLEFEFGETGKAHLYDSDGWTYSITGGVLERCPERKLAPIERQDLAPEDDPEDGFDADGYLNPEGVEVVGSWRWIPALDHGIVIEVEKARVFAPLKYIIAAFLTLLLLLLVSSSLAFESAKRVAVLQQAIVEGEHFGQYTLLDQIGEGGLGTVYQARHARLRRPTAIKLLKSKAATALALRRFEREVQLTAGLTHPNTIAVYDYGRSDSGVFYYAMEYLDGVTIAQVISQDGVIPLSRTLHILRQVLASLQEAHDAGLIHRDIKPLNVMVNQRGGIDDFVKVLDFGLAKEIDPGRDARLTRGGIISGTALYIAPERIEESRRAGPRSDIYSVGIMAFQMLTGEEPYEGETPAEILLDVLESPVRRVNEAAATKVPREVDDLIFRCMSKDPDDRPESAAALEAILAEIQLGSPWTSEDAAGWWRDAASLADTERE
jgi:hypothetical protein